MEDIRLKTERMELDGKMFELSCSFNVLADIEVAFGGITAFLRSKAHLDKCRVVLSSMMNMYAEKMHWDERYTPKRVGELLPPDYQEAFGVAAKVIKLVMDALIPTESSESEGTEKN